MTVVRANAIDIEYEAIGPRNGSPMVLIMGLGMQLTAWPDEFCQGLANRGFRVIRFDNRDTGLSTKMPALGPLKATAMLAGRDTAAAGAAALWPQRHGARCDRTHGCARHRSGAYRRRVDGRHDRADRRRRLSGTGQEPGFAHVDERQSPHCQDRARACCGACFDGARAAIPNAGLRRPSRSCG